MGEVKVNILKGGLGRLAPSTDGISGMILIMPSIVGGVQSSNTYKLESVADAEALLITQANDLATECMSWTHINDFFRMNPEGTLYIYVAALSPVPFSTLVTSGITALLLATNGKANLIGCAYNGAIPASNAIILAAITAAQTAATNAANDDSPIHVLMDGNGMGLADDVRALNSHNVSVVAAQNLSAANYDNGGVGVITPAVDKPWKLHTAVGLVLGAVSKAAVNESIAWVEKFNLLGGNLTEGGLLGTTIIGQETNLSTMEDNGFITIRRYNGLSGLYFNAAPTSTDITSDFATIQNNRTINKAVRLIRLALLPYLNSPINVDPTTGQLAPAVVKNFQNVGLRSLDQMARNEEFSSATVTVDPSQNILSTSELVLSLEIVLTGTAESIVVNVGLPNPFN